jgi:hypothetical protein
MAPPVKQENLPALEDCCLLLKDAVEIKLKASHQHFHDAMALVDSSFFGTFCQGHNHQGGLRGSNNQLSSIGQIFGTDFYVAYVNGQLCSILCSSSQLHRPSHLPSTLDQA